MLTENKKVFAIHYIKTKNATESYLKAYKCSYNTANTNGSRLAKDPDVCSFIEELERTDGYEDATEQEIRQFFTRMMRNKSLQPHLRMRSAEILGRNFGLTVENKPQLEKMNIKFNDDGEALVHEES